MSPRRALTLFLSGDVMIGRGIDQILPTPGDPRLFERWARSAMDYVQLAERASGPIPRRAAFDYVWGEASEIWSQEKPDARIINLETAITAGEDADPDKGIHYRMHPGNVPCLTAAAVDCCVLANNHVLDWGRRGLSDTLSALHAAGIATAGAGRTEAEASSPAAIAIPGGRLLVYGFGFSSSGVPRAWRATRAGAGVNWLADPSTRSVDSVHQRIERDRRPGDLVVISLHWGGNWGYGISPSEREFAHRLIDRGGIDLVHGHSSHHPKGIEIYRGKTVLYGCGDLLNDYEGIQGHESFRPELGLMYFPVIDTAGGELLALTLVPVRTRGFRLQKASAEETAWLAAMLDRECKRLGACGVRHRNGALVVDWARRSAEPPD
ncbi:MAG TPA: CapA family protein [Steroidobacteraceae bacterium]|nr:CapA family protein [Steroidobacteraceae bacterium]